MQPWAIAFIFAFVGQAVAEYTWCEMDGGECWCVEKVSNEWEKASLDECDKAAKIYTPCMPDSREDVPDKMYAPTLRD
ncbi:hypothetical protein HOO65_050435 [Ceratocystis lukuohia]|uniref:Extracellular membrane protein CFEM domain-containing protein n=1 Tax=Ceratocystis lukuohia TaxID=2019550 RepID=A0ABR4MGE9_9PEZI